MSRFILLPNFLFEKVYDTFDNSNGEMEYTEYTLKHKDELVVFTDTNDGLKKHKTMYQTIVESIEYECITESSIANSMFLPDMSLELYVKQNEDGELDALYLIDSSLKDRVIYTYYTYESSDGGVEEILNTQDIFMSPFDSMYDAMCIFTDSILDRNIIFRVEE